MKLSILDQSPIRSGGTAHDALMETITLAQAADAWGYERFWVAEHHGTDMLAGSAPEVLLAAIGAATQSIRIGSGGVMLPHYAPFKVAETFSMLATLYPERVDLGIGRAPGSDMETARMLAADGLPKFAQFPQLVQDLQVMLTDDEFRPKITPRPPSPPPIWLLGSSPESAMLGGRLGLPYNFALFITKKMSPHIFQLYRRHFQPSAQLKQPRTILTINVMCAETEKQAKRLTLSRRLSFLKFVAGHKDTAIPTVEEAENYPYTPQDLVFIRHHAAQSVVGTPQQVKEGVERLATKYDVDEIMALTITHDFDARLRSYELLAEQFL